MENNQQNNRDKAIVSTRGYTWRNATVKIPCALEVAFYGDMVRLSFVPPLPESERGEKRLYDYQNAILTNLSRKNCHELYTQYKEVIVPAIKEKKQKFVSVEVGENKNHIGISTGFNNSTDGECHPCIILIRGIDPKTKKSNDVILYEFVKNEVFEDYNPITGEVGGIIHTDNELDTFMEDLETARAASTKAYVHAARSVDKTYKDMLIDALRSVQDKMGIQQPASGGYSRGGSSYNASGLGYGSIFNTPQGDAAEERTITSSDELANALG